MSEFEKELKDYFRKNKCLALVMVAVALAALFLLCMFFSTWFNSMVFRQEYSGLHIIGTIAEEGIIVPVVPEGRREAHEGIARPSLPSFPFAFREEHNTSALDGLAVIGVFFSAFFLFGIPIWLLCSVVYYYAILTFGNKNAKKELFSNKSDENIFSTLSGIALCGIVFTAVFILSWIHLIRATDTQASLASINYATLIIYIILAVICAVAHIKERKGLHEEQG